MNDPDVPITHEEAVRLFLEKLDEPCREAVDTFLSKGGEVAQGLRKLIFSLTQDEQAKAPAENADLILSDLANALNRKTVEGAVDTLRNLYSSLREDLMRAEKIGRIAAVRSFLEQDFHPVEIPQDETDDMFDRLAALAAKKSDKVH